MNKAKTGFRNYLLLAATFSFASFAYYLIGSKEYKGLQRHEVWWEKNVDEKMSTFKGWLGDIDAPSRIAARKHIKSKGYKKILDAPCGLCTEFFGYQHDNLGVEYTGLDITPKLVALAKDKGVNAQKGSIESIPFADSSFDLCYSRHILEHLSYYEKALSELVRVANKEVFVTFFIKPKSGAKDAIDLSKYGNALLYHNRYDKDKLERYVKSLDKVASLNWEDVGEGEEALHIYLKS